MDRMQAGMFRNPIGAAMISGAVAGGIPLWLGGNRAAGALYLAIGSWAVMCLGPAIALCRTRLAFEAVGHAAVITFVRVASVGIPCAILAILRLRGSAFDAITRWSSLVFWSLIAGSLLVSAAAYGRAIARLYVCHALQGLCARRGVLAAIPLAAIDLFCVLNGAFGPAALSTHEFPTLRVQLIVAYVLAHVLLAAAVTGPIEDMRRTMLSEKLPWSSETSRLRVSRPGGGIGNVEEETDVAI
jgi:hypothetical protein